MEQDQTNKRRNLWLASFGAMLEYYDFVVYIYVASKISAAFFPAATSESIKLLQTLGIYSLGFLVRPLAGIAIAHFADRAGRKRFFVMTVALMSISTFGMGLLPTYSQVGWVAPCLLLLLRVVQGCAVGGELPSAGVFVSEHAGQGRAGYAGGVLQSMSYGGFLLGAFAAMSSELFSTAIGEESLAWRLPFLIGGAFGLVAGYLRRKLDETPAFIEAQAAKTREDRAPLRTVFRYHLRACIFGLGIVLVMSVVNVVFFQFWPTLLEKQLGYSHASALAASLVSIACVMASMPAWGALCDRFGWYAGLGVGAALLGSLSVWFFAALPNVSKDSFSVLWMVVPVSITCGSLVAPAPGILSSLFPTQVRQSGYAVAYNIGVAVFGGPLPVTLVWITTHFGLPGVAYLVLATCILSIVLAASASKLRVHHSSDSRRTEPAKTPHTAAR